MIVGILELEESHNGWLIFLQEVKVLQEVLDSLSRLTLCHSIFHEIMVAGPKPSKTEVPWVWQK